MAITRLTPVATSAAAVTTLVSTLPTGIVNGTLLKMVVSLDILSGTMFPVSGWTLDSTDVVTNGDHQTVFKLSRVSDGTDGSTVSVSPSAAGHNMGVVIGGWNGCDTTTGSFGAGERAYNVNNPNIASAPASPVTLVGNSVTANAGDQIVMMGAVDCTGANGVYSGFGGSFNTVVQTTSTDNFCSAFLNDAVAAGGATGTLNATWTQSGTNGNFVVYMMALKSTVAPPPPVLPQGPMPRRIFILP